MHQNSKEWPIYCKYRCSTKLLNLFYCLGKKLRDAVVCTLQHNTKQKSMHLMPPQTPTISANTSLNASQHSYTNQCKTNNGPKTSCMETKNYQCCPEFWPSALSAITFLTKPIHPSNSNKGPTFSHTRQASSEEYYIQDQLL